MSASRRRGRGGRHRAGAGNGGLAGRGDGRLRRGVAGRAAHDPAGFERAGPGTRDRVADRRHPPRPARCREQWRVGSRPVGRQPGRPKRRACARPPAARALLAGRLSPLARAVAARARAATAEARASPVPSLRIGAPATAPLGCVAVRDRRAWGARCRVHAERAARSWLPAAPRGDGGSRHSSGGKSWRSCAIPSSIMRSMARGTGVVASWASPCQTIFLLEASIMSRTSVPTLR